MSLFEALYQDATPQAQRAMLKRVYEDPGLPASDPTDSFWLAHLHPRFAKTLSSPRSASLPEEAFAVIIGSGITGVSIARNLIRTRLALQKGEEPTTAHTETRPLPDGLADGAIVMLDAREITDGATGRNGGHINEAGYEDYPHLKQHFGKDVAMKMVRFRMNHIEELQRVAREENVEVESQVRAVTTLNVVFDKIVWECLKDQLREFKEDFGDEAKDWRAVDEPDTLKQHHAEGAQGIIMSRAGAVWPYRLSTGILANLLRDDDNFFVFPFTPVTKIENNNDGTGYLVTTPRGTIRTKHVLHCTNSHVSHHVPGLRDRIIPLRGHMSAQKPPPQVPCQGGNTSWLFSYATGFDYLTQLPPALPTEVGKTPAQNAPEDGEMMMFGGGIDIAGFMWPGIEEVGIHSDAASCPEIRKYLANTLNILFKTALWSTSSRQPEQFRVKDVWSGIMGFSSDEMPWVGRLPASATGRAAAPSHKEDDEGNSATAEVSSGEWVSAGYSGEGMVHAWGCGKALSLLLMGRREEAQAWFPPQFYISEARIRNNALTEKLPLPDDRN